MEAVATPTIILVDKWYPTTERASICVEKLVLKLIFMDWLPRLFYGFGRSVCLFLSLTSPVDPEVGIGIWMRRCDLYMDKTMRLKNVLQNETCQMNATIMIIYRQLVILQYLQQDCEGICPFPLLCIVHPFQSYFVEHWL